MKGKRLKINKNEKRKKKLIMKLSFTGEKNSVPDSYGKQKCPTFYILVKCGYFSSINVINP